MEYLDGEMEVKTRNTDGLEVSLIWNSFLGMAYSRVHDHKTGERFTAIADDGIHPKETFDHPYIYRVGEYGDAALQDTVELQVVRFEDDENGKGTN